MQCLQVLYIPSIMCILSVANSMWAFQLTVPQSQELERIANGIKYHSEKYPYIVALNIYKNANDIRYGLCSGTMVSKLFVLTAAHCSFGQIPSNFRVFLGSTKTNYETVVKVYQHPLYNYTNNKADITLLKLKAPFPGLNHFAVISGHPDDFGNGKELNCVALGFGKTESGRIPIVALEVNVIIRYKNTCFYKDDPVLSKEFLCAKPEIPRICGGDSGGPVICGEYQYGLTSHTIKYSKGFIPECGDLDNEDQYLFVQNYNDWVYSYINSCPIIEPDKCCTFITFNLVILVTFLVCL